jgi:hypothetical protein
MIIPERSIYMVHSQLLPEKKIPILFQPIRRRNPTMNNSSSTTIFLALANGGSQLFRIHVQIISTRTVDGPGPF